MKLKNKFKCGNCGHGKYANKSNICFICKNRLGKDYYCFEIEKDNYFPDFKHFCNKKCYRIWMIKYIKELEEDYLGFIRDNHYVCKYCLKRPDINECKC